MLGADYTAGGIIRHRRGLRKRMVKNSRRRGRLKWWRGLGGAAPDVARGGTGPSLAYGATAAGLPPKAAHLRRRLQGATTYVAAGGSSLTTRLAIGGHRYSESDPRVHDPNPPLAMLTALLWDRPQLRSEFIDAWNSAAEDLAGRSAMAAWSRVRGIVSAAWAHLRQHGAEWIAPFRVKALRTEIDLIATPPKQVQSIIRAHARWHFDRCLIERIVREHCDDHDVATDIMHEYRNGIDWDTLRSTLREPSGPLTPLENRALHLLCTQALWPEERRWRAGMLAHGSCTACLREMGTIGHRIHDCPGVQQHMTWQVVCGRRSPPKRLLADKRLLPLTLFGLPPRTALWQPAGGYRREGLLQGRRHGHFYGDGSGSKQDCILERMASWALYLQDGSIADSLKEVENEGGTRDARAYVRGENERMAPNGTAGRNARHHRFLGSGSAWEHLLWRLPLCGRSRGSRRTLPIQILVEPRCRSMEDRKTPPRRGRRQERPGVSKNQSAPWAQRGRDRRP